MACIAIIVVANSQYVAWHRLAYIIYTLTKRIAISSKLMVFLSYIIDRRTRPLIVSNCVAKPAASGAPGTKQAFNLYRQYALRRYVS